MKINKFDTKEEDGKLYVYVEIPFRNDVKCITKFVFETEDVVAELTKRNIKFGKCLSREHTKLKNWREYSRKGRWIFEIFVDKSAEPVILEEEKSVRPKPKRARRTRSSTTKVSTEE